MKKQIKSIKLTPNSRRGSGGQDSKWIPAHKWLMSTGDGLDREIDRKIPKQKQR